MRITQMTRNLRTPLMCTAVLALVVFTARPGQAQTAHNDLAAVKQGMGAHMMPENQKMMADMKASQKKLDDLVAAMNEASGEEKINKLAAVVTELVAQHREMCAGMMSGNMMPMSMMQHAPEANAPAPAAKPEDDHATHHPKP
jgi:hypothetical protein